MIMFEDGFYKVVAPNGDIAIFGIYQDRIVIPNRMYAPVHLRFMYEEGYTFDPVVVFEKASFTSILQEAVQRGVEMAGGEVGPKT